MYLERNDLLYPHEIRERVEEDDSAAEDEVIEVGLIERFSVGKMTSSGDGWDATIELVYEECTNNVCVKLFNFNWIESFNPVSPPEQYELYIENALREIVLSIERRYNGIVSLSRAFFTRALEVMREEVLDQLSALMEELKPEYNYIYDVMEMESEEHTDCND